MYTAQVTLKFKAKDDIARVSELFTQLIACWYKNGQVTMWPSPFALRNESTLNAYVLIPEKNSLTEKYCNIYVRESRSRLEAMGAKIKIEILGKDPEGDPACRCKKRSSLIMFTHYLTVESPVCCGDCFKPVPLYHLPYTNGKEYFDWRSWQSNYKSCDGLQMRCVVGELYHERQLFEINSDLTKYGLELRSELAQLTNLQVYYHLHKSRGRSKTDELKRRCPICSKPWLLKKRWHIFDFRCVKCGLVSAIASSLNR